MSTASSFVDQWLSAHPRSLSESDARDLKQFGSEISRLLGERSGSGDQLDEITLSGDPEQPTVSVIFHPGWAKSVRWSFEWRLRDCADEECDHADLHPLAVMLVDHLGNAVHESLATTPGLPLWEPDADGVIHVDVTSERFFHWPKENEGLGSPWWGHEEGQLVTMDWESRKHSPWIPPKGHPWESLEA